MLSLAVSWWHTCWYPFVSVRLSSVRSFPPSWWGPALLLSLGALPVRSSGLSRALVDLPGYLLCLLPGYRLSSSQFPVVWLVLLLPSVRPCTRPLFGLLAIPPFLLSGLVAVCFLDSGFLCSLADSLVLGSSFPVLVIYSFLLSEVLTVASGSYLSAPLVCFILLSLTACLLFLFLRTAFPGAQ